MSVNVSTVVFCFLFPVLFGLDTSAKDPLGADVGADDEASGPKPTGLASVAGVIGLLE